MIYLKRTEEPSFWTEFKRRNPNSIYDDLQNTDTGKETRNRLREYNVNQQHGLCAYCCKRISVDNSLNEHIKPRGQYSNLSMDYSNIVASCKEKGTYSTCSSYKKNEYDERLFVSPLSPECEVIFEFHINGEIVSDSDKGKYTIDLLNLNSYRLVKARAAQIKVCESYNSAELVNKMFLEPDDENNLQPFPDIVKYFFNKDLFE